MSTPRFTLPTLFAALRAYQWPKNLVVFAGLVFGGQLLAPHQVLRSLAAFAVFCAASSAVYLFNDVRDAERDRLHPVKRFRPVASGALPRNIALMMALGLLVLSLGGAFSLGGPFLGAVAAYAGLMFLYTLLLKRVFIVDVLTVATGFVIRAVAGALVLGVGFTNWLVVCTFFLALFLSLCKRRREFDRGEGAAHHREVFDHYSRGFLDSLILLVAGATLLTYVIYTCAPEVIARFHSDKLYVTIPFVAYGLFRYLYLVHHRLKGEDPSRTFLEDGPLIAAIALWGVACAAVIYGSAVLKGMPPVLS